MGHTWAIPGPLGAILLAGPAPESEHHASPEAPSRLAKCLGARNLGEKTKGKSSIWGDDLIWIFHGRIMQYEPAIMGIIMGILFILWEIIMAI